MTKGPAMNPASDGGLLRAFQTADDQEAMAELLRRHGGMVLAAARGVVGDTGAAEDVAQATFLTLVRKAAVLAGIDALGGWLYHVAVCLARNERLKNRRRQTREQEAAMLANQPETRRGCSAAASAGLHEAIADLPAAYRAPLVLHYFEGKSYEAAAAELGLKPNAFGVRLNRAREKLRQRLVARGIGLGAAGIDGALEENATSAVLPPALIAATCQAASLLAAGKTLTGTGLVSAKVAYLTKSALKTLFWAKVKTVTAICAVAVLVGGAGVGAAITIPLFLHEQTTTASKDGLISTGDAWTRELLVRAEAGSWEAIRWGRGPCATGDWRMEMRGGPAERRIWNTQCDSNWSMVAFDDGTRWKRGVIVGRMMIPADGKAPLDAAVPPPGTNVHWRTYRFGLPNADATLPKARKASLVLNFGPPEQMRSKLVDILDADRHPHGVWHRYAVYFDTQTPAETIVAVAVWPEARAGLPPASEWNSETLRDQESNSHDLVGAQLGLAVNGVLMQTQGLKLVPLGPDLPPLPSELRREPRQ